MLSIHDGKTRRDINSEKVLNTTINAEQLAAFTTRLVPLSESFSKIPADKQA